MNLCERWMKAWTDVFLNSYIVKEKKEGKERGMTVGWTKKD